MNHSTETSVADDLLRNGYERWVRLEEEKAVVSADLKELFAELKAHGFDGKALRAAFRTVAKVDDLSAQEHNAVVDLYVNSLLGNRVGTENANAQARSAGEPEHNPETGEITEPQPAPQVEQGSDVAAEPVASRTIQPETANEFGGDTADVSNPNNGGENEDAAEPAVEPLCRPQFDVIENSSEDRTHEVEVATTSAPIVTGEGALNASVTPFTPKPLRPYCLNPGKCAGMGKKHCWACEKAHAEQQGAA